MKYLIATLGAATLLFAQHDSLGEIWVTTTTKLSESTKNSTANITVITAEEIAERGYQSVPEALRHVGGFSLATNGGAGQASSIYLRGFGNSDLLIMIDGIEVTDYSQPSPAASLDHIPLGSIERIEIVKGAQSGVWGANAVAGVINIVTKKGEKKNTTDITLTAGSHTTGSVGINFARQLNGIGFTIGGTWLRSDGISALGPSDAEEDGYTNKDLHLKTTLALSDSSTLTYFLHSFRSDFDYDTGFADDTTSLGETAQLLHGLLYRYTGEALTIDAKLSSNTIERTYESPYGLFETEGDSYHAALTARYAFDTKRQLTTGIDWTENSALTTYSPETAFSNRGIFASYSHALDAFLGASTLVNVALRYDDFDAFDDKFTYRLGMKRECALVDGLYGSANIYSAYKAPSIAQFSNTLGTLKPESTEGYELTLGYKKLLTLTYFRNTIKDKIIANYDPLNPFAPPTYSNSGDGATIDGIEVGTQLPLGESGFVLGANYTYLISDKDDSGKSLQRVPKQSANLFLDYYFDSGTHIGISGHYVGDRRDVYFDPLTWVQSDVTLESYALANLSYNTKLSADTDLSIHLKNIFDTNYETVAGYSTEGRSVMIMAKHRF